MTTKLTFDSSQRADKEKQTSPEDSNNQQYLTGTKLYLTVTAITLAGFLVLLDVAILSTATPKITSEFHSLPDVGWYGAAYLLASASLLPLTGQIYTNFSTKWTFLVFFSIFELGSLICGVSISSNMLIVGRAVAGMGAAGLQNGVLTILAGCVPLEKQPALMGLVMGGTQVGTVVGPLVGGVLTEFASWRWCFYINLPLGGLVAVLLVFIPLPQHGEKSPPREVLRNLHNKLDLPGFVLFTPGAIMLLLAIQYGGNQHGWNSPVVIGLLCGGTTNIAVWMCWNFHKKDAAMIPLSMLKRRYVWASCLLISFVISAMSITSYYLPIFFQGVQGKSPAISGVYLFPSILSQLFCAIASGKAVGYFGYHLPWSVASAVMTAIGYGLLSTLRSYSSTASWIGYQILTGTGRGLGLQMALIAVQNSQEKANIPIAMGLLMFSQTFTSALMLGLADTIFINGLRSLLARKVPNIDVEGVIEAGAYGFRKKVSSENLASVVEAYGQSIGRVFYMCSALAVGCFVVSWATGFTDIRKDRNGKSQNLEVDAGS